MINEFYRNFTEIKRIYERKKRLFALSQISQSIVITQAWSFFNHYIYIYIGTGAGVNEDEPCD